MVTVNFGGFYDTVHDDLVERALACEIDGGVDDDGEINGDVMWDVPSAVYKQANVLYCKEWLELFNEWVGLGLKFDHLASPRFYNFATDVIIADYSDADYTNVEKYITDFQLEDALAQHVKTVTTSCDGYHAFYSVDELKEDRDLFLSVMLDVIIEQYRIENGDFYCYDFGCNGLNIRWDDQQRA